ncbi:MAG: HDOD domain-containing protein [Anaeromyxobacter sp.]
MAPPPEPDPIQARRILACPTLPSLPAVALETLRLCQSDEIDLGRIAETVGRDPAITAKLLRAANSASLATRGKVATLTRAVALVGTNATLSIALSFSLVRGRRRADGDGFDHAAFWRRALFSALAGRALAELRGLDQDELFVTCLLQDLGVLALQEVFGRTYGELYREAGGDHERLEPLEQERLGVTHTQATTLLLRHWNLPEQLQRASEDAHATHAGPGGALQRRFEVVHLSGRLADVWVAPAPAPALERALAVAVERLGAAQELVSQALARMALTVPEAATDFDVDLGGPDHAEVVLAEAAAWRRSRTGAGSPWSSAAGLPPEPLVPALALAAQQADAHGTPFGLVLAAPTSPGGAPAVREALAASVRGSDGLQVHGEALAALLFTTGLEGATAVARRVRTRLAASGVQARLAVGAWEGGPADAAALLHGLEQALELAEPGGPELRWDARSRSVRWEA